MPTTAQQIADIQAQNNQLYRDVAREQMSFQERMSNTAHTREVKDMLAAGLNPVLSATGGQGATTPSGAQAEVDTQSMVSYLINEMNNDNARAITNAQVAAQRYAADRAYAAAVEAANATRYAADAANNSKPLAWAYDIINGTGKMALRVEKAIAQIAAQVPTHPNGSDIPLTNAQNIRKTLDWLVSGWWDPRHPAKKFLTDFANGAKANGNVWLYNLIMKMDMMQNDWYYNTSNSYWASH